MGLFSRIFYGVDLDEEQRRQDDLYAKLAELNRKALEDGKYTPEEFRTAEQNRVDSYIPDVGGEVERAFDEGLQEGIDNEQRILKGTVNTLVGAPLRAVLGGIPGWVWIVAAAGLFFWIGGFKMLRGKLA